MAGFRKRTLGPGQYEMVPDEDVAPEELKDTGCGKILVGSIFINDSEQQCKWLDLQLSFLRETTTNFHHAAVVFKKTTDYFQNHTHVIPFNGKPSMNSAAHIMGLKIVLDHFKSVRNQYSWFLFLDSDAFPIRKNWLSILQAKMTGYDVAVPIRFENLEQRLHASILLSRKEGLENLNFGSRKIGTDLLRGVENDVTIGKYQDEFRSKAYVLMRSNQYNVNPLLCGVYYDMFYHHCCGSGRSYNMRGRNYWNHVAPMGTDVGKFTDELMENPKKFIAKLAGWNPGSYPAEEN